MKHNIPAILALISVMGLELFWLVAPSPGVQALTAGAVLAVVLAALPRLGLREAYLITLCAGLSLIIALRDPAPLPILASAIGQAAFLMAFILLVGLIQQAAATSLAMRDCGEYLTGQRAGRRYLALFGGTHLMSQIFNLGSIALLTPLIMRGTEDRSDPLNPVRQRRQLTAMLRGFAWAVIWSPTAIAPLTLMVLLPDARRGPWIAAGLGIALVIALIGWAEDHWHWRGARTAARLSPEFPRRAYGAFGLICLALLVLTLSAMWAFDQSVVFGLMVAAPVLMTGWLLIQNRGDHRATGARIGAIIREYLPKSAPIAISLAASGFIGRAAAALTPSAEIAAAINLAAMPGWLFLFGLSLAVTILSWLALSPIMLAVFFGSIIADLPHLPVETTWAALAISCGWALSMTTSPFATIILMHTQITGHSGMTATWRWNWRFNLAATGVLALAYWLLVGD